MYMTTLSNIEVSVSSVSYCVSCKLNQNAPSCLWNIPNRSISFQVLGRPWTFFIILGCRGKECHVMKFFLCRLIGMDFAWRRCQSVCEMQNEMKDSHITLVWWARVVIPMRLSNSQSSYSYTLGFYSSVYLFTNITLFCDTILAFCNMQCWYPPSISLRMELRPSFADQHK